MLNHDTLKKLLPEVSRIAIEAGQLILGYYQPGTELHIQQKADHSPVTAADLAAHHFIVAALQQLAPFAVLSEESPSHRLRGESPDPFWLVDPLDGTKDFIARTDEFTVNIALVQGYKPVLGVVHAPVFEACYYALQGEGAFKLETSTQTVRQLATQAWKKDKFTVLVSRRHDPARVQGLQTQWPGAHIRGVGSSYKFCLLAEGSADLYLRRATTSIWDTAAGQCVVAEAGGQIFTGQGQQLLCNPKILLNPAFVAVGDPANAELQRLWQRFLLGS